MASTVLPTLALYHYQACEYCAMVREALKQLGIEAELRDIRLERDWAEELVRVRGRQTVPVLRIETPDGLVEFLAESRAILGYLESLAA